MSLINDMLRDLETRRKRESPDSETGHAPRTVSAHSGVKGPLWWGSGLLLVLAMAFWMGTTLGTGKQAPETAGHALSDEPLEKVAVDEKVVQQEDTVRIKPVVAAQEKNTVPQLSVTETDSPAASVTPARLLDLGVEEVDGTTRIRLAFAALPEYRLLQSGQGDAPLVVSFRHTRMDKALEIPDMAGSLLTGISLRPQQEQLQLLLDLGEQAKVRGLEVVKQDRQEHELVLEIGAAEPEGPAEAAPQLADQAKPKPLEAEAQATAPVRPQPAPASEPEPPRVSKSSSDLAPEKQAYQQGLSAMQQGNWAVAEDYFSQALAHQPEMLMARVRLVDSLLQQGKSELAAQQLHQGLAQQPGEPLLRKYFARYLLDSREYGQAIDLLRTQPLPPVDGDTEYHALLAGLLQQAGRFAAAARVYRQLLQVQADNALWWFGLALALDQVQEHEEASQAYQQALALPQLQDNLRSYSRERLRVL